MVEIPDEDLALFLLDFDYSTGKCLDQYRHGREGRDPGKDAILYKMLLKRIDFILKYKDTYNSFFPWEQIRQELVREKITLVS